MNNLKKSSKQVLFFDSALVAIDTIDSDMNGQSASQWARNVEIVVVDGAIESVAIDASPSENATHIQGVALPSIANVHSHAFQRGFVGLSEYRTVANDSFWTWRKLMYDFVLKLTPEDVYTIARQLYLEMLVAGYSWVGEFHYLHNDQTGAPFSSLSEMSAAVLKAANDVGIGICLLPVLYQRSGFEATTASVQQRRFTLSNDQFFQICEECDRMTKSLPDATTGMAIHSLRAASKSAIDSALRFHSEKLLDRPIHIHVAEQTKEIDDCVAVTGRRSVEYLMSEFPVDEKWCLIHATHLNDGEIAQVASSKATVGVCPTTEANLGDGVFSGSEFLSQGGRICIGSDSHCSVDFREELRTLEYGQRLTRRQRAILGTDTYSVGRRLYETTASGGGQAIGINTGKLAAGYRADLIVIDDQHPTIAGLEGDRLLDRLVFSNTGCPIAKRMVGGNWIDDLEEKLTASGAEFAKLTRRFT